MTAAPSIAICAVNFWSSFSLRDGFLAYLLERAFGPFRIIDTQKDADLVLTSVFPHVPCKFPQKTLAVILENVRPNYDFYARSLSSAFDSYGGRNFRLPPWCAQIDWEGRVRPSDRRDFDHGWEPLAGLESLLRPRETPAIPASRFCCYVARNPEPHRRLAVEALSRIEPVGQYGAAAGRSLSRSKYEVLPDYRFNLCFENSIFPGYYTEKALQAWVGGCIPLYWSDPWYIRDFNPKSMINRIDFPSLEAFVDHVAAVDASAQRRAEIFAEPLLLETPSLDGIIAFLRGAVGG